jgi:arylsulfatase A-like enzyme
MNEKRRSIILITVDCLRPDHVGFMGYKRPTTPFLDALAAESFVFPRAIVAGAPTYYSLPGILASRYPLALGRDVLGLAPEEPSLATALKHSGYATAAFIAANPYISPRFGYQQGFEVFRDFLEGEPGPLPEQQLSRSGGWAARVNRRIQKIRPALGPLGVPYDELYFRYCQRVTPVPSSLDELRRFPSADIVIDHACSWLKSDAHSPFFLWLHLMDPHSPYYPKAEALAAMGEREISPYQARYVNSFWNRSDLKVGRLAQHRDRVVALYDAGIRWVDVQVARLISTLRACNRWDECIFALTADHGEEFLDHGGRYHPPSRLAEELIHVPLLLRAPGVAKNEVSRAPFSLIHLAPTLLEAAGIDVPSAFVGYSQWRQLVKGQQSDALAISECVDGCTNPFRPENRTGHRVLSITDLRFKLVFFFETKMEILYDLEADPGEQRPLPSPDQMPVRRRLLEVAREHLSSSSQYDTALRLQARLRELQLEWANPADKSLPVAS